MADLILLDKILSREMREHTTFLHKVVCVTSDTKPSDPRLIVGRARLPMDAQQLKQLQLRLQQLGVLP
jgi:hypothetical protein